jgi:hypothetical protein
MISVGCRQVLSALDAARLPIENVASLSDSATGN